MFDAIDELVARSKNHPKLRKFCKFHKAHPEVFDFLVSEIRLRLKSFKAYSAHSLWQYGRWKLELDRGPSDTFKMNDHLGPFYARAIVLLHPEEFNSRCEFRPSVADEIFGTRIAVKKEAGNYARKLEWADGTELECWRPKIPHVVTHTPPHKPDVHAREEVHA